MAIFKRNSRASADDDSADAKKGSSWRRPANTAFKQQRLKAWQPILTPRTVLPTLFLVAVIFAPIGAVLLLASNSVSQITLQYSGCERQTGDFADLPKWTYDLKSSDSKLSHATPQWQYDAATKTCNVRFELPADLGKPVFLYYKLTNFYQNHRRYVRSLSTDQLQGKFQDADALDNSDCKPLGVDPASNKPIYPCGLIANSMFNDTIGQPILLNPAGNNAPNKTYEFSYKGIAWPGEKNKYKDDPGFDVNSVVPPPNWREIWPEYNTTVGLPKLASDEHFQNWMRTAGLPTFTKLYGRNDNEGMTKGTYVIPIVMNFPVEQFGGTKSIVISTVAWIGGKNPFLGWAYIATAGLFMLLALAGTVRHCIRPRKLGDMTLLSWNQPTKPR
ncbi:Lem3/Cdc50 [Exidia glandulosa HHB12029]|uniref:Lem3/Cdc50 n=1 Tax=Exidia glandulosa HHB12029 TaxID=1314781 RepID=A0A165IYB8_EXIGL|nr:Lem3/Cdc50 [Exidia glandulosa HHB12029]